ncbi:hypothetical protein [Aquimarina algiphila]|uniref:hypothetical protein n=1 Tax=Aquimarina algiphila TaxID=2047982 RepID=UPI0024906D5F|nr:hypothetical protein [Aquimarina algiphila]
MKPKYYSYTSLLLLGLIIFFGYINRIVLKESIMWSDRNLVWTDFEIVSDMQDGFDASVYSEIYCPNRITSTDSKVYAYMDPNQSERLLDTLYDQQLLKHEQYHFNITEYYARLMRKEIVKKGQKKISKSELNRIYEKYEIKRDSMQEVYDSISEHNTNQQQQRYWELKIDDLLRQTAYYQNPDILSYQNYIKKDTEYFKHIYHTLEHKTLTAYPVSDINRKYGKCYQVIRKDNEVIIKFYSNGKLINGGYFETAITKITRPTDNSLKMHYYNADLSYNTKLKRTISKVHWNINKDMTISYFDSNSTPVIYKAVHKILWKRNPKNNNLYATYYDIDGKHIKNRDGAHHERRAFDTQGRTVKIEAFDDKNNPINDKDYISVYDYVLDEYHKIKRVRLYNKEGNFATHLDEYNIHYIYDERGNLEKSVNLDQNGDLIENKNSICTYEYTNDLNDNTTSVKRYNANELPTTGYDDYFHEVIDYDTKNRILFKAKYHPNYVLVFDDVKNGALKYEYDNDSIYYTYNTDAFNNIFNNDHGVAVTKRHTNKGGHTIKEVFMDSQKCFATSEEGIETLSYSYDNRGNLIKKAGLDSIGNLKPFSKDIAIVRWEYDNQNNRTKTTYYNVNDQLANGEQNVAYKLFNFNKDNMLVERLNYDKHMKPALYDDVFRTRFYYDKKGKDTLVLGFNIRNQPINGVSKTVSKYSEYGKEIRRIYYNSKNRRTNNYNGVSAIEYLYDDLHRYIGYRNYNQYDRPTNDWQGVFSEQRVLNQAGYITKFSYFNKYQKPVIGPDGYHSIKYIFDDSHFITKESMYGTDNALKSNSYGVAIYEYTRAISGLIHSIKYYDENKEPIEASDGAAELYYKPDMNGLYYLDKKYNAEGEEIIEKENEDEISSEEETQTEKKDQ